MNIKRIDLDSQVGLKYDDRVILGIDDVAEFIEQHQEDFNGLDLKSIDGSQMLYGYNQTGNPLKLGFKEEKIQRIVMFTTMPEKNRFKVEISYDGHAYSGFQIQPEQQTIQGVLTEIISSVNGKDTLVQGASRTDTGVHAIHYVIHFDSDKNIDSSRWKELLNFRLPNDILVHSVDEVHPLFHSRYDVIKKRYVYKIRLGDRDPFRINYEWTLPKLDLELLKNNLNQFVGTHDFSSFCKGEPNDTIREIYSAEMEVNDNLVTLIIEGNGFLRYMIRIMVYALVEISSGRLTMNITSIMKEKNRTHTKHMAPACGLYLEKIMY